MPELDYAKSLAALRQRPLPCRVVMLKTDASFQTREVWQTLLEVVTPDARDFNVSIVACGPETGAGDLEALGEELPIMADRRVVWVRDVQRLATTQADRFAAYLAEASPQTVFYVTAQSRTDGKEAASASGDEGEGPRGAARSNLFKKVADSLGRQALLVKADLDPRERVQAEFESLGVTVDAGVVQALHDRTRGDLSLLINEARKLACHAGPAGSVRLADVDLLVHDDTDTRTWHLTDAIVEGDASRALALLDRLLDADQPALLLLGGISSRYRKLLKLRALQDAGLQAPQIAQQTGEPEWKVKKELTAARRRPTAALESAVDELLFADMALKSGHRHERLVLELLTLRLSRTAAASSGGAPRAQNPPAPLRGAGR